MRIQNIFIQYASFVERTLPVVDILNARRLLVNMFTNSGFPSACGIHQH